MMFTSFMSTAGWTWLHIHWTFMAIAIFGFIAGLVWVIKFASKKNLLNIVLWTIIIGVLGHLLTAPVSFQGWQQVTRFDSGFDEMIEDMGMDEMMEHMREEPHL